MERYGNLDDEDMTAEITEGQIHLESTGNSYEVYIQKFRAFVKLAEKLNTLVPAEKLNDHAIPNFLPKLGLVHQWKPHFKKAAQAAIRSMQLRAQVPLLFNRKDLYTQCHLVLAVSFKLMPYKSIKLSFLTFPIFIYCSAGRLSCRLPPTTRPQPPPTPQRAWG
jgi:hypothetical protein